MNPSLCDLSGCCSAQELWSELNLLNKNFLKKNTLEDLVKKHKKIKSKLKTK